MKVRIEGIGTCRLILDTGCHVDLEGCLYVPGCTRNLVFVAKLDEIVFSFKIRNNVFSLFKDMYYYGFDILIYGLYCFNFHHSPSIKNNKNNKEKKKERS